MRGPRSAGPQQRDRLTRATREVRALGMVAEVRAPRVPPSAQAAAAILQGVETRRDPAESPSGARGGVAATAPPPGVPSVRTAFDVAYEGTPTWDIGRPQGAVVRLAAAGAFAGAVIDLGCGTGANATFLAGLGHTVLGVDFAPAAIAKAESRARVNGSSADFLVRDALALEGIGRSFGTALDVGCFHTLQPGVRRSYAASVRSVLVPGGRLLLLCWSNRNPFGRGPERISRGAIRATFRSGWAVESIASEELETLLPEGHVHAWLAYLRRR